MSTYTDASLIVTPNAKKAGKLYSLKGADLDAVRATTATYVGSDGLNKTALANEVRFDYTNGSCPSILVEPQRTNLLLRSEEFNNAVWNKFTNGTGSLPVVTANYATAPDGNTTADRIQFSKGIGTTSDDYSLILQPNITLSSTGTATIFLKSNTSSNQNVLFYWALGQGQVLTVTPQWQRFTLSNLTSGLSGFAIGTRGGSGQFFTGGDETLDISVWGAQLEAGSNATSYIPTVASTVTRNADVISKSGISSLIGQTEGTMFADVDIRNLLGSTSICAISDNQPNNRIDFYKTIDGRIGFDRVSPTQSGGNSFVTNVLSPGRYKIALAYKSGDTCFFVNGIQVSPTYTSTFTFNQLNIFRLGLNWNGGLSGAFNDRINSCILFQNRLSNTELAQLTTL